METRAANGDGSILANEVPANGTSPRVAALEDRVRRLEDVVASLQDTRPLEERVLEGLTARLERARNPSDLANSAGLIIDAGRRLLPAAVGALQEGVNAADAEAQAQARGAAGSNRRPWLLFEVYADLRTMMRMYVDPRYRMGWQGRILPVALLGAIVTSWFWLPGTATLGAISSALGTLYMKAFDLAIAFVLCKVVHREVQRYREISPDLPPSLRL
jgi:hypothetical protein